MGVLGIEPEKFWKLTTVEFWSIYYGRFGRKPKVPKAPSKSEVKDWEKKVQEIWAKKKAMKNG